MFSSKFVPGMTEEQQTALIAESVAKLMAETDNVPALMDPAIEGSVFWEGEVYGIVQARKFNETAFGQELLDEARFEVKRHRALRDAILDRWN